MQRYIVLLRGINLGPRNRISMPELRGLLDDAGFEDVQTYLQSGNVVLAGKGRPNEVARECERRIASRFKLEIAVVVRTRSELAKVVARNPLAKVVDDPKRYQVTFLAAKLPRATEREVAAAAAPPEQVVVSGREIYAWHPDGVRRSKLAALLARRDLGVPATARNWSTVTKLLELAEDV
jgi:uncharacterized protein (DUF1697 family)